MVCREIGKDLEQIKNCQDSNRQILLEMLYRYAGLRGREIGELMESDYSTVILPLASTGSISMVAGAVLHQVSSLVVILKSIRMLLYRPESSK